MDDMPSCSTIKTENRKKCRIEQTNLEKHDEDSPVIEIKEEPGMVRNDTRDVDTSEVACDKNELKDEPDSENESSEREFLTDSEDSCEAIKEEFLTESEYPTDTSSESNDAEDYEHQIGETDKPTSIVINPKNSCIYCGKRFRSVTQLPRHFSKCHKKLDDDKIIFVCPSCGEEFAKEQKWSRHCSEVHEFKKVTNLFMTPMENLSYCFKNKYQCLMCSEILKKQKPFHLLPHASTHMPHQIYKCRHCCEQFKNKKKIREHWCAPLRKALTMNLLFVCPVCGEEFESEAVWDAHLMVEHDLDNPDNLNIKNVEGTKYQKKCGHCSKTWPRQFKRKQIYHAFSHMPFKIRKCKICKYESGDLHIKLCYCHELKHKSQLSTLPATDNSTQRCTKCDAPFEDAKQLKCTNCAEHNKRLLEELNFVVAEEGASNATYECTKCKAQAAFRTKTYQAMLLHSKRKKHFLYKCIHCNKLLDSQSFFQRHEAICAKQFSYIPLEFFNKYIKLLCPACGQENGSVQMLNTHLKKVHDFDNLHNLNIAQIKPKKCKLPNYKCTLCKHIFTNKFLKIFQNHAFSHMPLKLYNCAICSQGFDEQLHIVNHLNEVHNVDKKKPAKVVPNPDVVICCPVCDAQIKSRTAFRKHIDEEHRINSLEGTALKKFVKHYLVNF